MTSANRHRPGLDLVGGFNWTDSGNAERLVAMCGADLRFVPAWGKWHAWDGKRWPHDEGAVYRAAKRTMRALFDQASKIVDEDRRKAAVTFAMKSESHAGIRAMVALARHERAVIVAHEAFDADVMLFNCANGTIDLRTGERRPHRREDLLTKISPVAYDESATCERFDRFVPEIMAHDAELVEFLRRFLGYCLTGDVREHTLAFWYGTGGNGKSLLVLLLLYILGDYAAKAAPDLLFRSELTDRHPTELVDLYGRRLIVCNETTRGRSWDEGTLKDVTGGDRIRARRMREDFWEWDPTHKIIVFGNHKPQIRSVDDAIGRRLRLVPFAVNFEKGKDTGLFATLKSEASGVLRWLVSGCLAWQRSGMPEATAVREATTAYMRDEDTLGQFLERECIFASEAKVARKELRERYSRWAEDRDERPVSAKALAEALRRRGVTERQVHTVAGKRDGWAGVRLAVEDDRRAAETPRSDVVTSSGQLPVSARAGAQNVPNRESVTTGHYLTTDDQEGFADYLDREGIVGVQ